MRSEPWVSHRAVMRRFLSLFGEGFADPKLPLKQLLLHVWIQKFVGINRHVPWPVHWTSQIREPTKISRGTRFPGLALGCYLDGRAGIIFGQNCWLGPGVKIVGMNHDLHDFRVAVPARAVEIGPNSWIASNAIILPGVHLGEHSVVAAGAVVTKSFPEGNLLIAGVPATPIKRLESYRGVSKENLRDVQ